MGDEQIELIVNEDEYTDIDSYHLEAALELILGTEEVLSQMDVPASDRIQTVREASNMFIRYMTECGNISGSVSQ